MISKAFKSKKDQAEVLEHAELTLDNYAKNRASTDRQWFKSILFYRGEQWVRFDTGSMRFQRINHRRTVPRPTTNKMKPTLNSIISTAVRFEPKFAMTPRTDKRDDTVSATTANQIIRTIEHEVNFLKRKTELFPWLVITGNAFLISGFNAGAGARVLKVKAECPRCGTKELVELAGQSDPLCKECAKDDVDKALVKEVDESGNPTGKVESSAKGKMVVEVANPFQMFFDYRISDMEDQHTVIRIQPKDVTWIKTMWPELEDDIEPDQRRELSTHLTDALSTLTAPGVGNQINDTTADIVEVWHKPCTQFPRGYFLRYIGHEVILDLQEYPYLDGSNEAFYPITHFVFDRVPGTALGSTPAFDLIEKQYTRNRIEAIGEAILLRMSNPVWLRPTPGTMSDLTGKVGQVIDYDPNQTGNHLPQRINGVDMPPSIVAWMGIIDRDFQEISAQFEVSAGDRPKSVRTASAVQALQNVSQDRNMALLVNISLGLAEWQQQIFEIFRIVMPEDRYFRILGEQASWTVSKVQAADLQGGVDIIPEPSSILPKTHSEQAAILELFMQNGLVNPADPLQLLKIYQQFGMEKYLPNIADDDAYIAREHDGWDQSGEITMNPFDNHALHIPRHLSKFKSEGFQNASEEAREAFLRHIGEHQEVLAGQQEEQVPEEPEENLA